MQIKKIAMLLLALHIVNVNVFSQEACTNVFSGLIVDENKQPIIGAGILLLPQQNGQPQQDGQESDSLGHFRFTNICSGRYRVKVQYLGYRDEEFTINIDRDISRTIQLSELVTELHEVVIQHHDAAHTENSANFVELNEKQLAESAGKSLGESLKEVPGVSSIQTGPGIFKPVIHGVHSQRVLILNHGIRQEGQQWGAEHAPEIDPFIASNIIVIKDASAIKYGTDAIGGVIVVNPPELPDRAELGGTINTVLQSNGRSATISGMLEGGINKHDGWGWRVQGTAKRTGDFRTPGYVLTNSGIQELNFSSALGYHKKNIGFDIFFSHFQTTIGILKGTSISSYQDLVNAMDREPPQYTTDFSYKISEPKQQVSHNLLKLNGHIRTDHGEWRLQYGFQNNHRQEFDIRIGDLSSIPALNLQLNTHTLDAEWETVHNEKRTISFGMNSMFQGNRNIFGTKRIPFIPNFNNLSGGVFGTAKIYVNNITVDLGARYDYRHYDVSGRDFKNSLYHANLDFHNVSATAGTTILLPKKQEIDISVSSAWRPPHVAELYSIGTHQSAAANEYGLLLNDSSEVQDIKNTSFKIEQALKWVTTYHRQWRKFQIEISPYANYIFNYIYLRPIGLTKTVRGTLPALKYFQTDALFLGMDITGTLEAARYFKIIPRVSLLRASDEREHNYLINIPSNRYEVAIRYERPDLGSFRNFYLESKTKYIAQQYRAPRVISPEQFKEAAETGTDILQDDRSIFDFKAAPSGYFLWNLAAGFSVKNKKTQYDFRIASENTLNQSYREYTNRFRYYANDLGRNIIFSVKCIF
jgi:iron complex outermembrane receptor protein